MIKTRAKWIIFDLIPVLKPSCFFHQLRMRLIFLRKPSTTCTQSHHESNLGNRHQRGNLQQREKQNFTRVMWDVAIVYPKTWYIGDVRFPLIIRIKASESLSKCPLVTFVVNADLGQTSQIIGYGYCE